MAKDNNPASTPALTKALRFLRQGLDAILSPHPSIQEPERRRVFLLSALLLTLILAGVVGFLLALTQNGDAVILAVGLLDILVLLIAFILNHTKDYRMTPIITIAIIGVMIFLGVLTQEDPNYLFFLILGLFVSSLYPSPRMTSLATVYFIVIILLLSLVNPSLPSRDIIAGLFLVTIAGAVATVGASIQSRDFKHIDDQSRELSFQLNELVQNRKALQQSESLLKLQIERMPIGCIVIDPNLDISSWNPAAEKIFGFSAKEAIGQHFDFDVPQEFRGSLDLRLKRFIREDTSASSINENITKDGRTIICEWMDVPLKDSDGKIVGLLSMVQDITKRTQAEQALNASEDRYHTLFNRIPIALYRTSNTGKIVECNDAFVDLFGYPNRESMLKLNARQLDVDPENFNEVQKILGNQDELLHTPIQVMRYDQTPIWVEDSFRVVRDSQGNVLYHEGSLEDITGRVRAEEQIRKNNAHLAALAKISQLYAGASRNNQDILDICTHQVTALIGNACAITLLSASDQKLHLTSVYHSNPEAAEGLRTIILAVYQEKGEWFPEVVARDGKPVNVANLSQDEIRQSIKPDLWPLLEKIPIHSILIVPMRSQDRLIGTLGVSRDQAGRPYGNDDQVFLQEIADRTALAIINAQLFEKVQHSFDKLQALRQIDIAISGSLDLRISLGTIIDQALTQTGVDAANVLVLNPQTHVLDYMIGKGFRTNMLQHTQLRLGEGYAGRAALERKTIHISDIRRRGTDFLRSPSFREEAFISYFAVPLIAKGQVKGVVEIFSRQLFTPDLEWVDFIEALAGQGAIAIDNANLFTELQRSNQELSQSYDATIEGWSHALDLRDKDTEGHTQRVTRMTLRLAQMLSVNQAEWEHIRRGALLHDVGKMAIPDNILLKPGPLTSDEWEVMHKHPQYAYEMIASIPYLRHALDIPLSHHEKWDGNGYPRGLSGEQIPLSARIFAIVDVWDALSSDRPYRLAWPSEKVRQYLEEQSGKQFDPYILKIFFQVLEEEEKT